MEWELGRFKQIQNVNIIEFVSQTKILNNVVVCFNEVLLILPVQRYVVLYYQDIQSAVLLINQPH